MIDRALRRINGIKSHLAALVLGLSITLLSAIAALTYYFTPADAKDVFFFKVVNSMHTKSIDLRMNFRGYRLGEKDFAIIAIDERSLETYGRWPWSRALVAQLIDQLFKNGARAVGLDILYPETSNDEIQSLLDDVASLKGVSGSSLDAVKKFSRRKKTVHDADGKLVAMFEKYGERLSAAATYGIPRTAYSPYQRLCYDLMYQQTSTYNIWEKEGYDFIDLITDVDLVVYQELPIELEDFVKAKLEHVRKGSTKEFCEKLTTKASKPPTSCPSGLNSVVNRRLERIVGYAQREYCSTWLEPDRDRYFAELQSLWPRLSASSPQLRGKKFRDYMENLRNSGLKSALLPADFWTTNIPRIHQAARYTGFLNVHPDIDGTIRKIPLLVRTGPHLLPSLSLRLAMNRIGADGGQISLQKNLLDPKFFEVKDLELTLEAEVIHKVVTDSEGQVRIGFHGPRYTFPHISAKEILEENESTIQVTQLLSKGNQLTLDRGKTTAKSFLKGKTVIIGATAVGVYDLRVTPFDENYPGVEGHVTVIDNIVNGELLSSPRIEPPYMIVGLIIFGALLSFALAMLGAIAGLALSASLVTTMVVSDYLIFFQSGLVTTLIFPLFLALALYISITIFKYFTEERKKRALRGTFEKYVSPAIVSEILEHPDNLKLGGRKEHMTVFFSDIRGFTTISEALDPEELSELLNLYLTPMTELVFENNGTLDKYMGDAIMAFFGAPVTSPTHAADACRCALDNLARLEKLNIELKSNSRPTLDIGIGLNTGDMSVGNMGSESVRSYTVMGDAVNLGARLEGINKQYGTRIIISEFTERELDDSFVRREIDWVKVKGKEKPVRIFELIAEGDIESQTKELLTHFRRGFHLYHQRKWQQAIDEFQSGMEHVKDDPVSRLFTQRCHEFLNKPPDGDWDGVFVMTTK